MDVMDRDNNIYFFKSQPICTETGTSEILNALIIGGGEMFWNVIAKGARKINGEGYSAACVLGSKSAPHLCSAGFNASETYIGV